MKEFFQRIKVNFLLASVVYIVLGLVLVIWPHTSSSIICAGFGIFLLLYGAITIISFFVHDSRTGLLRFELILGILFAGLGIFFLVRPDVVLSVLPVVLGVYIVIDALLNLKRALELRRMEHGGWTIYLVLSLITVVLGLVVVFWPMLAGATLVQLIGAALVYSGAADLWTLFQLSRWTKEYRKTHPVDVDPLDPY